MMMIITAVVVAATFVVGGLIGSGLTNAMRESRRPALTVRRPGGRMDRRRPTRLEPPAEPELEPELEPEAEPVVVTAERLPL